jgi:hypothetical protein
MVSSNVTYCFLKVLGTKMFTTDLQNYIRFGAKQIGLDNNAP